MFIPAVLKYARQNVRIETQRTQPQASNATRARHPKQRRP